MIPQTEILIGDVRAKLRELKARGTKVRCCVTSPPYWALRDYGTSAQAWGGLEDCDHAWGGKIAGRNAKPDRSVTGHDARGSGTFGDDSERGAQGHKAARGAALQHGQFCRHCGAWSGELGLEPTPELFVEHIVEVFRHLWDVLADDGTLWMNFGDSYNGSGKSGGTKAMEGGTLSFRGAIGKGRVDAGLKPKDLVGMPWRVAFALQADGWYLRQEIIWSKPNPMPESVEDRCTKSHEHIFLLTKRPTYHFNQEAILEDCSPNTHARLAQNVAAQIGSDRAHGPGGKTNGNMKAVGRKAGVNPKAEGAAGTGSKQNESFSAAVCLPVTKRNKRSVWTVPTQAYSEAHYATFPEALVVPCILAGTEHGDTVIDIFGGSGTTALVANQHGRHAILIDLNPVNEGLMRDRLAPVAGQGLLAV